MLQAFGLFRSEIIISSSLTDAFSYMNCTTHNNNSDSMRNIYNNVKVSSQILA